MTASTPLAQTHEFRLGGVHVRPAARTIQGSRGSFATEPLVMQVLVQLSRNAGRVVTRREIFERCWGGAPVGDDSLNRVVAALRRTLTQADAGTVTIETIPGAGYTLRFVDTGAERPAGEARAAIEDALDSIRLGLPEPDYLRLEILRHAVQLEPDDPAAWGMRSLLCRYAAEYAPPDQIAEFVAECHGSAREALRLHPGEPHAEVALATIAPIFGRWAESRSRLGAVLESHPEEFTAEHELVICDMATGRVRSAVARTDRLIAADPLAACMIYKGIYQRWSSGDFRGMEELADRGIQLWPSHPAIWTARMWTLAFTDRLGAAMGMLNDDAVRPEMPQPTLQLLKMVVAAAQSGRPDAIDHAAVAARNAAASGPARAISALFALCLLGRLDDAFAVADAYYLRLGSGPVPVRRTEGEPSINDQHRRVTQILFTPVCAEMRGDRRFLPLCEKAGLKDYWERTGLTPDFLA